MNREIVEKTARVAHIALTDEELDRYSADLDEIFKCLDIIIDAPEIENRGFNPVEIANVLREDVPSMEIPSEDCLKDMKIYDGYIKGPRIP